MKKQDCIAFTDSELVSLSLKDTSYFECLYNRYESKLILYIKRISYFSDAEALDILQECFINVWRNLNDFDSDLSFNSWIYRIVHHQTVSHWRKSISYGKNKTVDVNLIQNLTSSESRNNDNNEENILKIMDLLPEKYKLVLVLKYFEQKDYVEISDILKIPEGTVATHLNRAKKAFKELSVKHKISFFD